ncbi:hypothetical protein FRC14_002329 [Serendipita sp. 396]|nr:hypothetical protein FRC14_002329 [Serendipita sp. 396]
MQSSSLPASTAIMSPPNPHLRDNPERLKEVDDHIASLRNMLAFMEDERRRLTSIPSSAHPIGVPEVLGHIMEWGVHLDCFTPEQLLLVSRHWHNVALSTPGIWARIVRKPTYMDSYSQFLSRCQRYLDRSKNHPLYIDVDFLYFYFEAPTNTVYTQFSELVQPHLARCYHISLANPRESLVHLFSHLSPDYIEHIAHYCANSTHRGSPLSLPAFLPKLRHLSGTFPLPVFATIDMPALEHLQSALSPVNPSFHDLLSILQRCTNLKCLLFDNVTFTLAVEPDLTSIMVDLEHLNRLEFHCSGSADANLLTHHCRMPNLRELCVTGNMLPIPLGLFANITSLQCGDWDFPWFVRALRVARNLEHLTVRAHGVDSPFHTELLPALSTATTITTTASSSSFASLITASPSPSPSPNPNATSFFSSSSSSSYLVPKLKTLHLISLTYNNTDFPIDSFLTFLRKRASSLSTTTIERLVLEEVTHLSEFNIEQLKTAVEHLEVVKVPVPGGSASAAASATLGGIGMGMAAGNAAGALIGGGAGGAGGGGAAWPASFPLFPAPIVPGGGNNNNNNNGGVMPRPDSPAAAMHPIILPPVAYGAPILPPPTVDGHQHHALGMGMDVANGPLGTIIPPIPIMGMNGGNAGAGTGMGMGMMGEMGEMDMIGIDRFSDPRRSYFRITRRSRSRSRTRSPVPIPIPIPTPIVGFEGGPDFSHGALQQQMRRRRTEGEIYPIRQDRQDRRDHSRRQPHRYHQHQYQQQQPHHHHHHRRRRGEYEYDYERGRSRSRSRSRSDSRSRSRSRSWSRSPPRPVIERRNSEVPRSPLSPRSPRDARDARDVRDVRRRWNRQQSPTANANASYLPIIRVEGGRGGRHRRQDRQSPSVSAGLEVEDGIMTTAATGTATASASAGVGAIERSVGDRLVMRDDRPFLDNDEEEDNQLRQSPIIVHSPSSDRSVSPMGGRRRLNYDDDLDVDVDGGRRSLLPSMASSRSSSVSSRAQSLVRSEPGRRRNGSPYPFDHEGGGRRRRGGGEGDGIAGSDQDIDVADDGNGLLPPLGFDTFGRPLSSARSSPAPARLRPRQIHTTISASTDSTLPLGRDRTAAQAEMQTELEQRSQRAGLPLRSLVYHHHHHPHHPRSSSPLAREQHHVILPPSSPSFSPREKPERRRTIGGPIGDLRLLSPFRASVDLSTPAEQQQQPQPQPVMSSSNGALPVRRPSARHVQTFDGFINPFQQTRGSEDPSRKRSSHHLTTTILIILNITVIIRLVIITRWRRTPSR